MVEIKIDWNGFDWFSSYSSCFGFCKRKCRARRFKEQCKRRGWDWFCYESIEFLMATGSIGLHTCLAGKSNFFDVLTITCVSWLIVLDELICFSLSSHSQGNKIKTYWIKIESVLLLRFLTIKEQWLMFLNLFEHSIIPLLEYLFSFLVFVL